MCGAIAMGVSAYRDFSELSRRHAHGRDYGVVWRRRASPVLLLAPHGGRLEAGTDHIVRAVAGRHLSYYLFLAVMPGGNPVLHLPSTSFDEPMALSLVAGHDTIIAVHGCKGWGQVASLGGLDETLKEEVALALERRGVEVRRQGHPWPGRHPLNICNRGRTGRGVQLELTWELRHGAGREKVVEALKEVLVARQGAGRRWLPTMGAMWGGLLALVGLGCQSLPPGVEAIQGFQLEPYLGRWHEIARLDHSFERGYSRVTAEYSLLEDGRVHVVNRGFKAAKGEWKEAVGKARVVGKPGEGRLEVSFFGPFYGAYNIIALAPDLSVAMVCGSSTRFLWILARKPGISDEIRQRFVEKARGLGFPVDDLLWVEQTPDPR